MLRAQPVATVEIGAALTRRSLLGVGAALLGVVRAAWADDDSLPKPQGRVILTVTGAIGATNAPDRAEFDFAMLERLGVDTVHTWTPWTEGSNTFTGVLARRLMGAVAAAGQEVIASALNDFKAAIPLPDFASYDVILATSMNGEPLAIRDKGPIWIIYPWAEHPELDDLVTRRKSVWQLRQLHVQ